jgi:hypothetical protein
MQCRVALEIGFFWGAVRMNMRFYNMSQGNALVSALILSRELQTTVSPCMVTVTVTVTVTVSVTVMVTVTVTVIFTVILTHKAL